MTTLVTEKRKPPAEIYEKTDRRKAVLKRKRYFLEECFEEEEIHRKALRREKNLAFSKYTRLEKERVRSKVTPEKSWDKIETERGVKLETKPPKKGRLGFARVKRKTPVIRPTLQTNQGLLRGFRGSRYQREKE